MINTNHPNKISFQRDITNLVSFIAARIGGKAVRRALPRMRVTIRSMMLLVALAALLFQQFERRNRFLKLADFHQSQVARILARSSGRVLRGPNSVGKGVTEAESNWHEAMAARYRAAAKTPWLPLGPDPELSTFEKAANDRYERERRQPPLSPRSWEEQRTLRTGVLFSPDGRYMFTDCEKDQGIRVWDAKSLKERYRLSGYLSCAGQEGFSSDGGAFLTIGFRPSGYKGVFVSLRRVTDGGEIRVWNDIENGPILTRLVDSGRRLLILNSRRRVVVWDVADGRELSRRDGCVDEGIRCNVRLADVDRAGRRIVSLDDPVDRKDRLRWNFGAVRAWDLETGRVRLFVAPPADFVNKGREGIDTPRPLASLESVRIDPDGEHVVGVRWDGALIQWRWDTGAIVLVQPGPSSRPLYCAGFGRNGSPIYASGVSEEFFLLHPKNLRVLQTVRCPAGTSLKACAILSDRILFAAQGPFVNHLEPGGRLIVNPENGGLLFGTPMTIQTVPLSAKGKP